MKVSSVRCSGLSGTDIHDVQEICTLLVLNLCLGNSITLLQQNEPENNIFLHSEADSQLRYALLVFRAPSTKSRAQNQNHRVSLPIS